MPEKNKNPFKDLDRRIAEVPPELKRKVMNDVATARLLMDLASLFGLNYPSVIGGLFKTSAKK